MECDETVTEQGWGGRTEGGGGGRREDEADQPAEIERNKCENEKDEVEGAEQLPGMCLGHVGVDGGGGGVGVGGGLVVQGGGNYIQETKI